MKNFIYLFILSTTFLMSSCSEVLEEDPQSFLSPENFFLTDTDFETATVGTYGLMVSGGLYARWIHEMIVIIDGSLNGSPNWPEFGLTFDASWRTTGIVWDNHYRLINQTNTILKHLSESSIDDSKLKIWEGEMKFLRAMAYFDLVRFYGDLPLHLEPTETLANASKPRAPISEIYNAIISDLLTAELLLPVINQKRGRATKGAAKGLLANVYLTMSGNPLNDTEKLELAKEKLTEIVDTSNPSFSSAPYSYALEEDYQSLFYKVESNRLNNGPVTILQPAIENGKEAVIELNFFNANNGIFSAIYPHAKIRRKKIQPWYRDKFETTDYRADVTYVLNAGDPYGNRFQQRKFPRTGDTWNNHENNWPYLRYADLVLMLAEVENNLNGPTSLAFACINAIRERARNADGIQRAVPADYSIADASSKDEFFELLQNERIVEFCLEGKTWLDWMRWGTIEKNVIEQGRNYMPRIELFPIPQNQISITQGVLEQNTGY